MTQVAYAKRRGVTPMAVGRAIRDGRLKDSVVFDPNGKPLGIRDADLADQEWAANTDTTRALVGEERGEAKARKDYWQAATAELEFKEAAKQLIPAATVDRKLAGYIASCRTKLLGLPSQLKQVLPHLTIDDVTKIDAVVRRALEDLAGE